MYAAPQQVAQTLAPGVAQTYAQPLSYIPAPQVVQAGAPVVSYVAQEQFVEAAMPAGQSVIVEQMGDWLVCEDAAGIFYHHTPTQQSFDNAPTEFLANFPGGYNPPALGAFAAAGYGGVVQEMAYAMPQEMAYASMPQVTYGAPMMAGQQIMAAPTFTETFMPTTQQVTYAAPTQYAAQPQMGMPVVESYTPAPMTMPMAQPTMVMQQQPTMVMGQQFAPQTMGQQVVMQGATQLPPVMAKVLN